MFVQTLNSHSNPSYTIEYITCCYDAPECVQHLLLELPQHALQQIQRLEIYSMIPTYPAQSIPPPTTTSIGTHPIKDEQTTHTEASLWSCFYHWSSSYGRTHQKQQHTTIMWDCMGNAIGAEGVEALKKIREIKKDLKLNIIPMKDI